MTKRCQTDEDESKVKWGVFYMRVGPSVGHLDKEASKWPWTKNWFWKDIEEIFKEYRRNIEGI